MGSSFAIIWQEDAGPVYAGKLQLRETDVTLQGSTPDTGAADRTIARGAIARVTVVVDPAARLRGLPTVELTHAGTLIRLAAVSGGGAVYDLAGRLTATSAAVAG